MHCNNCQVPMMFEDDCSATCQSCGKVIFQVVSCATYQNGGRKRTPYRRIDYFRKWISQIRGEGIIIESDTLKKIKHELRGTTVCDLRIALRKMRLRKHSSYKHSSYILSNILEIPVLEVSEEMMIRAEGMFMKSNNVSYYPDLIYEIFHKLYPSHPI